MFRVLLSPNCPLLLLLHVTQHDEFKGSVHTSYEKYVLSLATSGTTGSMSLSKYVQWKELPAESVIHFFIFWLIKYIYGMTSHSPSACLGRQHPRNVCTRIHCSKRKVREPRLPAAHKYNSWIAVRWNQSAFQTARVHIWRNSKLEGEEERRSSRWWQQTLLKSETERRGTRGGKGKERKGKKGRGKERKRGDVREAGEVTLGYGELGIAEERKRNKGSWKWCKGKDGRKGKKRKQEGGNRTWKESEEGEERKRENDGEKEGSGRKKWEQRAKQEKRGEVRMEIKRKEKAGRDGTGEQMKVGKGRSWKWKVYGRIECEEMSWEEEAPQETKWSCDVTYLLLHFQILLLMKL